MHLKALAPFGVLPNVQLVIFSMVQLVFNGTIGLPMATLVYKWYHCESLWCHWHLIGTNGFTNGAIGITIGTNGFNNGSIGRTLNTRLL